MNENRTFGIEIEALVPSIARLENELENREIPCHRENYNHSTRNYWKITSDGSIQSMPGYQTFELVSPILKGSEGKNELKKVLEALVAAGTKVNSSCGLHVHHDIGNFGITEAKRLMAIYVRFESALDTLQPLSRREDNNFFCQGWNRQKENILRQIKNWQPQRGRYANTIPVQFRETFFQSRYKKLNFDSWVRYGTVEFRHHSGTVNFEKIWSWVILTQAMVNTAETCQVQIPRDVAMASSSWFDFKKVIKAYAWMGADADLQEAIKALNKRRQKIARELQIELAA